MIDYTKPLPEILADIKELKGKVTHGRKKIYDSNLTEDELKYIAAAPEIIDFLLKALEKSIETGADIAHVCHTPDCKCKEDFTKEVQSRLGK